MSEPTVEQVESIVRAVMTSRTDTQVGVTFEGRLLGLRAAEGLDRNTQVVSIRSGTVITPLARDWLKKRGVEIQIAAERERIEGRWGFVVEQETGVTAALRRILLEGPDGWVEVGQTAIDAARWAVAAPGRGAAVLTDEASVSAWEANSIPGARAAVGIDANSVARAARRLGVNVLILEVRSQPIPVLRHLLTTFRRSGSPRRPDILMRRAEPDEDRRDHRPSHPEPRALGPAERALRDRLALAAIGTRRWLDRPG